MSVPAIDIRDTYLKFQDRVIFDNFNLHIPAGKWMSILGPSGVGKSTLLKFIAGLVDPHTVDIQAKLSASDNLSINDRVAYMAQTDLLMPWLSAKDNVLLGFRLRGVMRRKRLSMYSKHASQIASSS